MKQQAAAVWTTSAAACLLCRASLNRKIGRKGGIYEADSDHNGGSRGIGLAIAHRLGLDGYQVVIFATKPREACQEQLKLLEEDEIDFHYVQGTLDNGEDRKRLVEEALRKYGRIDVLVNNAGVAPLVRADLLDMTEESYDRVMGINTKGTLFLTQLVAKQMLKQEVIGKKRGTIVNVGSCSAGFHLLTGENTVYPKVLFP